MAIEATVNCNTQSGVYTSGSESGAELPHRGNSRGNNNRAQQVAEGFRAEKVGCDMNCHLLAQFDSRG